MPSANTKILEFTLKAMTQEKITLNTRKLTLNIGTHKEIHIEIMDAYIKKSFASTVLYEKFNLLVL